MNNCLLSANIEAWDRLAGDVRCTFPLERIRIRSAPTRDDIALDYGCGDGRFLSVLSKMNVSHLWGCDASVRMCELAKMHNAEATILHADFTRNEPQITHKFTLITAIAVLSSVLPVSARERLIQNLRSILAPGGRIVIADFGVSRQRLYRERYKACGIEERTFQTAEGLYIHHFTLSEIIKLLKAFRFEIIHSETIDVTTLHGHRANGHIAIGRRIY
jgi:SAM-dependent methyltransferase